MSAEYIPRAKGRRALISGFILFTAASVSCGAIRPLPDRNFLGDILLVYANYFNILQRWELFVPEPRRMATEYRVDIVYQNGKGVWRRTAAPNCDFFQRQEAYNFQKWDLAAHELDRPTQLWTDLATYIVHTYDRDPGNPMVSFKFIRAMADWPPPNESGYVGGDVKDLRWKDTILFTYFVQKKEMFH